MGTTKKEEFLKKMRQQVDELNYRWSVERNKLEAKSQHLAADVRQKIDKEWEDLGQLRKEMKEKIIDLEVAAENALDDFKDEAGNAWDDLRDGAEKAWSNLSEAFKNAASRFK
ncbi:MAG: hypothetical protein PVH30_10520 [Desulfobacterales bacterium]|jgi:hypothetical protein